MEDDNHFDVLVIGTGLTESITAAALSKAGIKVAHVDENQYYGGNDASLTLDELAQWADIQVAGTSPKFTSVSRSTGTPSQSRQYSICLRPSVIPSLGPVISSLIHSGVAKYGGFRLLERVGLYDSSDVVKNVPVSKEDVFKSKEISLVDKRRLMRFLMFAASEFEDKKEFLDAKEIPLPEFLMSAFSLPEEIASAIIYALAFSQSLSENAAQALLRIRRYLRSAGRYGPSSFLVGHYGGAGEIAQGFCRASAVNGGVYILGRRILSINHQTADLQSPSDQEDAPRYSIALGDFPENLTAKVVISSISDVPAHLRDDIHQLPSSADDYLSGASVARCIAVVDRPIRFSPASSTSTPGPDPATPDFSDEPEPDTSTAAQQPLDCGILVFPPSTVKGGSTTEAATVLVTGEGTMSTPAGKWIVYISLPLLPPFPDTISAEQVLQPYLNATLALSVASNDLRRATAPPPLFTLFYIEHPDPPPRNPNIGSRTYVVPAPLSAAAPLPDTLDDAAIHAEAAFWEVVKLLGINRDGKSNGDEGLQEGVGSVIDSFWSRDNMEDDSDGED